MKIQILLIFTLAITSLTLAGQTKKDSLYVLVGKKIEVKEFPQERTIGNIDTVIKGSDTTYLKSVALSMDYRFIAKYRVLHQVYGSIKLDTIEFFAFDHYGIPAFSKYENVLLYVTNYNDTLYHEKYQFTDVYKTKNGRWASGYRTDDYRHIYNEGTKIKPEPIEFIEEVSYTIKGRRKDDVVERFPYPYFEVKKNKATVKWGNYVEELFELKKNGILKARGIFD